MRRLFFCMSLLPLLVLQTHAQNSLQPTSNTAKIAHSFGQQDDISVLAITRSPALKAALA